MEFVVDLNRVEDVKEFVRNAELYDVQSTTGRLPEMKL